VKARAPEITTLPKDLPLLAVLGLTQPPEGDWGRLRGLQYASLARVTVVDADGRSDTSEIRFKKLR